MSSLPPDPYKILGVSKDAQLSEIRSAHRKLVLKCHPDKVQDPALKQAKQDEFQKVQQAYELLSDENERLKYDDKVKLAEFQKEMAAKGVSANTSASRSPRTFDVNIRTAEPRANTFKTSSTYRPSAGSKMYSQNSSRSYEEDLHRANPIFEEPRPRRAASYEKTYEKMPRQDEERERSERERERDRRRRKDEEREREREEATRAFERKEREKAMAAAAAERERERAEKKALQNFAKRAAADKELRKQQRKEAQDRAEKERDRERKQASAEKTRRKAAYVEPYGIDETYVAKDKKSSKKAKEEDKRSRSIPRETIREEMPPPPPPPAIPVDLTEVKFAEAMMTAAAYLDKSRKGAPSLGRAQTFGGFEPPLAAPTPPAAAPFVPPPMPTSDDDVRRSKSRRSSEIKREKSSHRKSPAKESHYVVEPSPTARPMHQYPSAHWMGSSPPKGLGRSSTFDSGYSRPPPGPARAQTFHYGGETDSRGRNRSKMQPQTYSEESDSEDDHRPSRRSHRHRMEEPIPLDYGRSTKYAVHSARVVPVADSYYRNESPPGRKYYAARPSLGRESSAYSGSFPQVKTSTAYGLADVQYGNIPHRYVGDWEYA